MKCAFLIATAKSALLAHLLSFEVNVGALEIGHGIDDDVKQILREACAGMKNMLRMQTTIHMHTHTHTHTVRICMYCTHMCAHTHSYATVDPTLKDCRSRQMLHNMGVWQHTMYACMHLQLVIKSINFKDESIIGDGRLQGKPDGKETLAGSFINSAREIWMGS